MIETGWGRVILRVGLSSVVPARVGAAGGRCGCAGGAAGLRRGAGGCFGWFAWR